MGDKTGSTGNLKDRGPWVKGELCEGYTYPNAVYMNFNELPDSDFLVQYAGVCFEFNVLAGTVDSFSTTNVEVVNTSEYFSSCAACTVSISRSECLLCKCGQPAISSQCGYSLILCQGQTASAIPVQKDLWVTCSSAAILQAAGVNPTYHLVNGLCYELDTFCRGGLIPLGANVVNPVGNYGDCNNCIQNNPPSKPPTNPPGGVGGTGNGGGSNTQGLPPVVNGPPMQQLRLCYGTAIIYLPGGGATVGTVYTDLNKNCWVATNIQVPFNPNFNIVSQASFSLWTACSGCASCYNIQLRSCVDNSTAGIVSISDYQTATNQTPPALDRSKVCQTTSGVCVKASGLTHMPTDGTALITGLYNSCAACLCVTMVLCTSLTTTGGYISLDTYCAATGQTGVALGSLSFAKVVKRIDGVVLFPRVQP